MNDKIKSAVDFFYNKDYISAREIFVPNGLFYEAGLCSLLLSNLSDARKYFKLKEEICPASNFGLLILDIIESKPKKPPKYFQVRSFLEIYINLLIENGLFSWAQKVIDEFRFFTNSNLETPKFIARVLNANNQNKAVHYFADIAKQVCYYDAEIHYIDATLYLEEGDIKKAKEIVTESLNFAGEYYPILRLKEKLENAPFL